ncbi:ferroxidase fet3 [Irineochytrium annulatum]|nr:ferroxidase fet3 [Irineochytrium annulatum]
MTFIPILGLMAAGVAQALAATSSTSSKAGATTTSSKILPATSIIPTATTAGAVATATSTYVGKTVTVHWDITYVNVNPDGEFERRAIGVNNVWPIPAVNITRGDTLVIVMRNSLDEPTSLHSHGMFQNGTGQYDGVTGVTQCAVPPGQNLTYSFTPQQHGTYWIHGHNLGHYVDGLRAPFIIVNPNEHNKYDAEYAVSIADWYHGEHKEVIQQFLSLYNPVGNEPVPDSGLINEASTSVFHFNPGMTYRLRLVSFGALVTYNFWIDGHDMQVIEVDGVDTVAMPVSSVALAPAQRYSVLVTARSQGNGTDMNYQMHAAMNTDMFDPTVTPADINPLVNATVIYASPSNPMFEGMGQPNDTLDDTMLLMYNPPAPLLKADTQVVLAVIFQVMSDGINHGTFNNLVYTRPNVPTLFSMQTLDNASLSNPTAYGWDTNPFVFKHMDVVEVVIDNTDGGNHPFHLHGHVFQVIEVNPDHSYDPMNLTDPATLPPPMVRDTIVAPGGGYVVIRFVADNPGAWFFHCHIEWHFSAGLIATFIEAPEKLNLGTIDPTFAQHCAMQGIPTSGNAAGNKGLDMSGLQISPRMLVDGIEGSGWGWIAACAVSALLGCGTVIWFAQHDKPAAK